MQGLTKYFGFITLDDARDSLPAQFKEHDLDVIDQVLAYLLEGHTHNGQLADDLTPSASFASYLNLSSGTIPSGASVHYRYSLVDAEGRESPASNEQIVQTPLAIDAPRDFGAAVSTASGTFQPGRYTYWVSAYTNDIKSETQATPARVVVVPVAGAVTITFPPLPSGATGWNVYRQGPLESEGFYLFSSTATSVDDAGTTTVDPYSTVPNRNTTNSTNSFECLLPALPASAVTWRVYRTYDPFNWTNSLVEQTSNTSVLDYGYATKPGSPILRGQTLASPGKVDLEDAANIDGVLPPGRVDHETIVNFTFPGRVVTQVGDWLWVSEFNRVEKLGMRAAVGRGYAPLVDDIEVGLYHHPVGGGGPDLIDLAVIPAGQSIGDYEVNYPDDLTPWFLEYGDALSCDVLQAGGGATPTDYDLTISVHLIVRGLGDDTDDWDETHLGE